MLQDFPPSLWSFDHAIVYVPALSLFLDPTEEYGSFGEISDRIP